MKQIVPFTKKIELKTNVEEITSISLDHTLKSNDKNEIVGEFELYFEYKENDISVNIEKYEENIPFNINLDDKYVLKDANVEVDDFYYEIDNSNVTLHIDVLIDNIELEESEIENIILRHDEEDINKFEYEEINDAPINNVNLEEKKEELELNNINFEPEVEVNEDREKVVLEDLFKEMETDVPLEVKPKVVKPIFETFDEKNETYVTYTVHIVREDDNVDSICKKYEVSREDLSNYNDIKEIKLGDKLIVPTYKK